MIAKKILDELAQHFSNALPPRLKSCQQEFEKCLKSALQAAFQKLNLVTREEFDLQVKLLAKAREELQALAEKVSHSK